MHGPGPTSRDPSYQTPDWPWWPFVDVLDTVARSLRWRRRRRWRRMRDEALARWATPMGITFTVREALASDYPTLDPHAGDAGLAEPLVSPWLRLMTMPDAYAGVLVAVAETAQPRYDVPYGGYAAFFMPGLGVLPRDRQINVITHEVGHVLGLDHRPWEEPAESVMRSTADPLPDAHDIASLKFWYEFP